MEPGTEKRRLSEALSQWRAGGNRWIDDRTMSDTLYAIERRYTSPERRIIVGDAVALGALCDDMQHASLPEGSVYVNDWLRNVLQREWKAHIMDARKRQAGLLFLLPVLSGTYAGALAAHFKIADRGSHWSLLVYENGLWLHFDSQRPFHFERSQLLGARLQLELDARERFACTDVRDMPQQRGSICGLYLVATAYEIARLGTKAYVADPRAFFSRMQTDMAALCYYLPIICNELLAIPGSAIRKAVPISNPKRSGSVPVASRDVRPPVKPALLLVKEEQDAALRLIRDKSAFLVRDSCDAFAWDILLHALRETYEAMSPMTDAATAASLQLLLGDSPRRSLLWRLRTRSTEQRQTGATAVLDLLEGDIARRFFALGPSVPDLRARPVQKHLELIARLRRQWTFGSAEPMVVFDSLRPILQWQALREALANPDGLVCDYCTEAASGCFLGANGDVRPVFLCLRHQRTKLCYRRSSAQHRM
jgi:hypothetical protein